MSKLKTGTSILLWLLMGMSLHAQDAVTLFEDLGKGAQRDFKKAKKEAFNGNIEAAKKRYTKVLEKHPKMQEALLNLGGLYQQEGDYGQSERYYKEALVLTPESYPLIQFQLGVVYKKQKKYALAAQYFDAFLVLEKEDKKRLQRARRYAADMHFAAEAILNPVEFKPERLSSSINSTFSEYTPVLRGDGKELIFTRRSRNQEDFYRSTLDTLGQLGEAVPLVALNTPGNEGAHTISADGNYMVFTACDRRDGFGLCDLYYSKKEGGEWTAPINLGKRVNSAASDTEPSLTADGSGLYFSSNRKGSIGGSDIWFTKRRPDGKWYIPVNLGKPINTVRNEESPFIHQDGVSLYFRSNAFPGMGGFDIYKSEWKDKQWTEPENLGYPINTEGSEGALTVSLDGKWAYYATDMTEEGGRRKDLDIYRFELAAPIRPKQVTFVSGQITDATTNFPVDASIVIQSEGEAVQKINSDERGNYFFALPLGKAYSFLVEREGYFFYSERFELDSVYSAIEPFIMDIALQPIPEKVEVLSLSKIKPIILKNIRFESGSSTLKESSFLEIERLVQILNDHPDASIKIVGHTDNVGSEEANKRLSQNRAQAVKEAMMEKGIQGGRLIAEGRGEEVPIADNGSQEGRKANRRTEFIFMQGKAGGN